jgi:hypothetical protein
LTSDIQFEIPPYNANATYEIQGTQGYSYEVKQHNSQATTLEGVNRVNDEIPNDDDRYTIAFGATVNLTKVVSTDYTYASISAPNFDNSETTTVTTAQLKNPALLTGEQQVKFAGFASADYQQILSLNPRATGGDVGDPARYRFLGAMPLIGLLPPTYDTVTSNTKSFTRDSSTNVSSGFSRTLSVKTELDVTHILKASSQISFTYSTVETNTQDDNRTATVTLKTATRDCTASYNVYLDTLFNTLAFKKNSSDAHCQ